MAFSSYSNVVSATINQGDTFPMAINVTTLNTNLDTLYTQLNAESDTQAHIDAMNAAVKADANAPTKLARTLKLAAKLAADTGFGQVFQPIDPTN
jgi:hypothetical protein